MRTETRESRPEAVTQEIGGQLVLDGTQALEMARAIAKANCRGSLLLNAERIPNFKNKIIELKIAPQQAVIVLASVNDKNGEALAEVLMPGYDWQALRNLRQIPYARGLVAKRSLLGFLDAIDRAAADALRKATQTCIVVIDHGVAEVFLA